MIFIYNIKYVVRTTGSLKYKLFCKRGESMKKIICKVEYDTENSELIKKYTSGEFGESTGYEEALYKTEGGKFFLYVNGGEESIYPTENITRMSAAKAEEWLANH